MNADAITQSIIGAAIEVHRHLGPGLLESVYHRCLCRELASLGIRYETEVPITVNYKGEVITDAYRADFLVEGIVVVELKAVDALHEKHKAQLLTYMRLLEKPLGLLINFNETVLKRGVRRLVNQY